MTSRPRPQASEGTVPEAYQPVAWLDLDPGQPEFSTAGQLSLVQIRAPILGPSFTHTSAEPTHSVCVIKAHALGALSPNEDPEYFLRCAADLMRYYDKHVTVATCGLVINCPGWVVGAALEVTSQLITIIQPSDIVRIGIANPAFETCISEAASAIPLHILSSPSKASSVAVRTSAELRVMQYMAYFHQRPTETGHLKWSATPIDKSRPWRLSLGRKRTELLGVYCMGEQPSPEFLEVVLGGALVAVCAISGEAEKARALFCLKYTRGLPFWDQSQLNRWSGIDPSNSRMLGLAWIQEIDLQNQVLNLQTPLPMKTLEEFAQKGAKGDPNLVLVYGGLDTPGWAYLESHHIQAQLRRDDSKKPRTGLQSGEDLSLPPGSMTDIEGETEEEEPEVTRAPWVKKVKRGDMVGQRWRVRRDIGRSRQERAGFEGTRTKTAMRTAKTAKA